MLFVVSVVLRASNVVGPPPAPYSAHPLDDDSLMRLVTIQKTFNRVAQPPRQQITLGAVNEPSMRYLVLINAGDVKDTTEVRSQLSYFEETMRDATPAQSEVSLPAGLNVPILMYHRTPADFEQQIKHLVDRGYTGITLDQLHLALTLGGELPPKPVIITLDDGYTDQLREVEILTHYKMPATMYVINGGAASQWCIGANKKDLPNCEAFLSWDEIRKLDRGGLITIGSHTMNHPNLTGLTAEQQRAEIIGGKQELEKQLGHPVYHLAYPYGAYNAASVAIAQQAGFTTAVTTEPGMTHTVSSLLTLTRLRNALELP